MCHFLCADSQFLHFLQHCDELSELADFCAKTRKTPIKSINLTGRCCSIWLVETSSAVVEKLTKTTLVFFLGMLCNCSAFFMVKRHKITGQMVMMNLCHCEGLMRAGPSCSSTATTGATASETLTRKRKCPATNTTDKKKARHW